MMGVPESDYDTVFSRSNIILSFGDPEYVPEGEDPVLAFMNAGTDLAELMRGLAAYRVEHPTDDLTSALVNANVDGESLTDAELASFFILLVVAGNETTRNAISHGLWALHRAPRPARRVGGRLRGRGSHRGRRDRPLGLPGHLHAPHRHRADDTVGPRLRGGRQGHPLLQLGQPRRGRVRGPAALRRAAPPQPPRRLRRAGPALLPGRAPGARRDHGDVQRAVPPAPRHRATAEPDRLRSNFINGIKHLPCAY